MSYRTHNEFYASQDGNQSQGDPLSPIKNCQYGLNSINPHTEAGYSLNEDCAHTFNDVLQDNLYIDNKALLDNVVLATKDSNGETDWLILNPVFYSALTKCATRLSIQSTATIKPASIKDAIISFVVNRINAYGLTAPLFSKTHLQSTVRTNRVRRKKPSHPPHPSTCDTAANNVASNRLVDDYVGKDESFTRLDTAPPFKPASPIKEQPARAATVSSTHPTESGSPSRESVRREAGRPPSPVEGVDAGDSTRSHLRQSVVAPHSSQHPRQPPTSPLPSPHINQTIKTINTSVNNDPSSQQGATLLLPSPSSPPTVILAPQSTKAPPPCNIEVVITSDKSIMTDPPVIDNKVGSTIIDNGALAYDNPPIPSDDGEFQFQSSSKRRRRRLRPEEDAFSQSFSRHAFSQSFSRHAESPSLPSRSDCPMDHPRCDDCRVLISSGGRTRRDGSMAPKCSLCRTNKFGVLYSNYEDYECCRDDKLTEEDRHDYEQYRRYYPDAG